MTDTVPLDFDTPEGWEQFRTIVATKTNSLAYKLAGFEGCGVVEAVNRAIITVANEMDRDGIPGDIVAAYLSQYLSQQPRLINNIAEAIRYLPSVKKRTRRKGAKRLIENGSHAEPT